MTRAQSARLKRHQKVISVLNDHAAAVAAIPAFQELTERYTATYRLLAAALEQGTRSSEGATESKGGHADTLIPQLVRHASALMLLLKKEDNLEAARNLYTHRSDYARLGGPELAAEADSVAKAAVLRQADLLAYGIKPEDVQNLTAAAARFAAAVPQPKVSIEQRKVGGATFRLALKQLDDFLKEDLKAGIELLATDYPQLYARLQEARRVDEPGYGRSAKAQARRAAKQAAQAGGAAPSAPSPAPAS